MTTRIGLIILPIGMTALLYPHPFFAQQYCAVGSQQWIAGCEASCTASWEGSDCPRWCTAAPPAGHVIMNHRVQVQSVNNGGHDVSRMAADQTFDFKRRVEQAYSYTLEMAGKAENKSAEAKIRDDIEYGYFGSRELQLLTPDGSAQRKCVEAREQD